MSERNCTRCNKTKQDIFFIEDNNYCRACTSNDESLAYIRTPIIEALQGLSVRQKQKVIRALIKDFKAKGPAPIEQAMF